MRPRPWRWPSACASWRSTRRATPSCSRPARRSSLYRLVPGQSCRGGVGWGGVGSGGRGGGAAGRHVWGGLWWQGRALRVDGSWDDWRWRGWRPPHRALPKAAVATNHLPSPTRLPPLQVDLTCITTLNSSPCCRHAWWRATWAWGCCRRRWAARASLATLCTCMSAAPTRQRSSACHIGHRPSVAQRSRSIIPNMWTSI